ncbi:hypothetical protein PR003_g6188 [Phytophthora rubi]|uniref:Uncharacterized protein n=1 Tax=Phytophthora rubi TaxID=129364 RepID=A0A6A3MH59_9STRA|nr:hypothetical protein PR002_g10182 [Phytophthora rubi]KAE9035745.1 hypothetical protein PR001_g9168 [Phytophthora rubi]KAE9348883.1 hypothetical protein PR003_g6188 [Phytophthora rubi]
MPTQQLLFTRAHSSPAWSGSDSSSPRRVTFAAPSPVEFRSRQPVEVASPYAADLTQELPEQQQQQQRRPRTQQQPRTQRNAASAPRSAAAARRPRPRRPGWDADVRHDSTLFDASLKRSLLFQPRAGDRRREEETERENAPALPRRQNAVTSRRTKSGATRAPVRYRSGPSSVYAQPRQNVTHWPQRRTKDFVRQNIEHLTGRPMDARSGRTAVRSGANENVFERLAAPRISKALLRSHVLPQSEVSPGYVRSPSESSLSPPRQVPVVSPVLMIDPPAPDKDDSLQSISPSPGVRKKDLGWSSPQRSQQSYSTRQSSAPRSSSTNRSSGQGSRTRGYNNYPARVFGVLDRDNEKRIGVSQILQGLRLLGLPATHNQISDYVYLIHEGLHSTIDLEEWEILVGTLDAASRPSSNSPRNMHGSPSPSPSLRSTQDATSRSLRNSSRSVHSNVAHSRSPSLRSAPGVLPYETYESMTKANVVAERQPIQDDDPYLEEIQNRIEGMFERAQATATLRWPPEPGNNQLESYSRSDRILKRAATVVYSLRASLFPLVHQAEATLREIQQRHGSKLSLFLPPGDMAAIAKNSDLLASAILDDILLDTVQLLNDEDKQQSYRHLEAHHADQLDDIMAHIQDIERQEDSMIQQGLALSYGAAGTQCNLPTALRHDDPSCVLHRPEQSNGANLQNLRLPLEVVMNINIPDSDILPSEEPQEIIEAVTHRMGWDSDELPSQSLFGTPLRTSILEGKRLQSIERKMHKFQHHRRLVEASLAETGMAQFAIIEILEGMLLDDLIEQTADELNDTVLSMSDTLLINLV